MAAPELPNVFAFRSRFPEFKDADDPEITLSLQIAGMWVDPEVWDETDYAAGILFWAAHFLTLKQQQLATVQLGGGGTDLFVRSIGIGERRVMFGERGAFAKGEAQLAPGDVLLNKTMYGMLYLALRNRNVPGVAVV